MLSVKLCLVSNIFYGDVTDKMFLNGTGVGREVDRDCVCICESEHWKPYAVPTVDGTGCVITTDTSCLLNKNAAAALDLQGSFRFEYCPQLSKRGR